MTRHSRKSEKMFEGVCDLKRRLSVFIDVTIEIHLILGFCFGLNQFSQAHQEA
jgi:hypothetical protein